MSVASRAVATLCTTLMLASPALVRAQSAEIGVLGGATFSTLRGLDVDQRTGTVYGAYLLLPFAGPFQLQIEGLATSRGASPRDGDFTEEIQLNYAEVPVMLRLSFGAGTGLSPHVYAGPYAGLRINCKVEGTEGECDDVPGLSTKSVDLGGIAGGGVSLNVGPLVLTGGARYNFGVSNIAEFDTGDVREAAKNGAYAVYAGVGIRFGR